MYLMKTMKKRTSFLYVSILLYVFQ